MPKRHRSKHRPSPSKLRSRLKEASRRRYERFVKRVLFAMAVLVFVGVCAITALFPPEWPADGSTQSNRDRRKERFLVDVFWNFMRGVGVSDRTTKILLISVLVVSCAGAIVLFVLLRTYDPDQPEEAPLAQSTPMLPGSGEHD